MKKKNKRDNWNTAKINRKVVEITIKSSIFGGRRHSFSSSLQETTHSQNPNMKFLIAFACVLAFAAAFQDANVIHSDSEVNVDSFKYAYEFDNSIKAQQQGQLKGEDTWVVNGDYSYTSPEGEQVSLKYTADENGYHVDAANPLLPTPPPIPDYILKAIEYIKAHPSADAHA